MTRDAILALFEQMQAEHWKYAIGAAEQGSVDCSGAFVYAYKVLDGLSLYHGSNYMARNEAMQLLPITQATAGMIAFKAREPSEQGYALPEKYRQGGRSYTGDVRDYYHVGLVSRDGAHVLNAQSSETGFVSSVLSTKNGWDYVGYGMHIDYGDEDTTPKQEEGKTTMEKATVTATSGTTVNMRVKPSVTANLVDRVPVGAQVDIVSSGSEWSIVKHDGLTGYMMTRYLTKDGTAGTDTTELDALKERIAKLEERVQALEGGVG